MSRNAGVTAAALLAFSIFYFVLQMWLPGKELEEPFTAEIERGVTYGDAVSLLAGAGLVRDEKMFLALGKLTGLQRRLTPGRYRYEGRPSQFRVYLSLERGETLPWEVTVVEGDTLWEIGRKLAAEGLVAEEDFTRLSRDRDFLRGLGIEAPSIEGYLYPDTYRFIKGDSPEVILGAMVRRLREMYDEELSERTRQLGMTEHKVLTLASIIEREAALDGERPLISAVYHNRMRKRLRLQADPTAIYGVKPLSAGVTREDIRRKTPYNTYTINGLPPGPISSPGIKSIRAALFPADVKYLYFVSNNDGSHTFSATHAEHMKAVQKYRNGKKR